MSRSILISFSMNLIFMAASVAAPPSLEHALQKVLEKFLTENESAPGVSAYVDCPTLDLEWSGAVGKTAHNASEPLTPLHTFRIASNTKTYVAAAILRLVEMDRLDLDASLETLLSADQRQTLKRDAYDLKNMTLRQVLSHTSGLAEHSGDQRYADAILSDPMHRWTPQEQIELCIEWFDPVGKPGEGFSYSDTGYVLLGGIIERLTQKNLGAGVRHLLNYEELGLGNTWWEYLEEVPSTAGPRAHQYYGEHDTTHYFAAYDLYGGGGIVTNAIELGRFMKMLLQGHVLKHEATLQTMMEEGTKTYRLGLMAMDLDGVPALGHQGFWNTFAFYLPSLKLTVSGCVLNHHAENGKFLAERLVVTVRHFMDSD